MKSPFISACLLMAVSPLIALNPTLAQAPASPPNAATLDAEAEAAEQALKDEWKKLGDTKNDIKNKESLGVLSKRFDFPSPLPSLAELKKIEGELKLRPPMRPSLALLSANQYVEAPSLVSASGSLTTTLNVTYGINWIGKDQVKLRSYNGQLVGPTLRVKPGDTLRITVSNQLPDESTADAMNTLHYFNTTNLHTHGLHVSPGGNGDNVLATIDPGQSRSYEIKIPKNHPCGTFWYHPHRHGSTAAQVASGMSGALIIEGGIDNLIKVARERVMVLNQILYVTKDSLKAYNVSAKTPIEMSPADQPHGVIEEAYKSVNLGPNAAAIMGRFTTINGVPLPVIHLRPGEIERWRFIDSSQSEILQLQLVKASSPEVPVPLHEIAVDGLPLGQVVKQEYIRMLPGNRSDVLVQLEEGEYLLTDMAKLGMKANPLPTQYVARVVVSGEPVTDQKLHPNNAELNSFRLPTLANETKVGIQTADYGIYLPVDGTAAEFLIDGEAFSEDKAAWKVLTLGNTDEWIVRAPNKPNTIKTGHPFHIHVNPIEIISIDDPDSDPKTRSENQNQLKNGPVWRDTIWIPNGGSVRFRTKYTDFTGAFVQHCHILDHEDQGMMQVIQVVAPGTKKTTSNGPPIPAPGTPAPDFELRDIDGKVHRLQDMPHRRRIVFFFKGHGCLHCAQQVKEFAALYEKFKANGIDVVGITSDTAEALKAALKETPYPFLILPDAEAKAFAAYGCAPSDGLLHGTFLLDEKGRVEWRTTGASPFIAVSWLLDGPPD